MPASVEAAKLLTDNEKMGEDAEGAAREFPVTVVEMDEEEDVPDMDREMVDEDEILLDMGLQ